MEALSIERPAIEKRRAPRYPARTPTEISIQARKGRLTGDLLDMSEDGMGFATVTSNLEIGEIVSVELPTNGAGETAHLKAVVRYSLNERYGLEFVDDSKV